MLSYSMFIPLGISLPFALALALPTPESVKAVCEAVIAVTLSFNLYINYKMKLEAIDVKAQVEQTNKATTEKLDTLTAVAAKTHTAVNGGKEVILRQSQTSAEANLASSKALYDLQPNDENKKRYEEAQAAVQAAALLVAQHLEEQQRVIEIQKQTAPQTGTFKLDATPDTKTC